VLTIASIEKHAAIPRLVPLLKDENPEVRFTTAVAIGVIERRADLILPLLTDKDPDVRGWVAIFLGRISQPREAVVSALQEVLKDVNEEVRVRAAETLKDLERADLLLPLLKDKERRVRERIATLLGQSGQKSEAVISALREALNDSDKDVRFEAAWAVETLKGEED